MHPIIRHAMVVVAALTAAAGRPAGGAEDLGRPALQAGALSGSLRLDGILDEPAWQAAPSIDGLVMVEPREGARPTGRTVARVLADTKTIVIGIRCEDPDTSGIVTFTKERDGDLESEDHVVVLLDPFQDGRSGYVFAVNPGGARLDALVQPGGEEIDANWDGEWEAATGRDGEAWTAEIRIPVHTLSFRAGVRAWGFNLQRRIQRLQETDRWASPGRDFSVYQASRAGLLLGLPGFDLGLGLGVRPALVGGFRQAPGSSSDGTFRPSLDATQRLGSNVLASLTVNTDFAETEADARQTNLTRFPLFFPEKRSFFLDGADLFAFGSGIGTDSLVPFFSRRIGLVAGREVPILGGLKATGRVGQTSLGALVVRTRAEEGLAPASTLGVLRVRQNVLAESRAGLLATAGDPLGGDGSWTVGADFTYQTSRFRGDKNFSAGVWGLAAARAEPGRYCRGTAFGFKVDYPNDLWDCFLLYRRIGDRFDPSLGFVPRRGIATYSGGCMYAPRPQGGLIRQMSHQLFPLLTTDTRGRWESYEVFFAPVNWRLESGERVELNAVPVGERLVDAFEVAEGVAIPAGEYHWWRYRLEVETAAKRSVSGQATWWFGGFYTGTLHQVQLRAAWTPSPLVTFLAEVERNVGRLPQGSFDITLLQARVRLNLSPDLQLTSLLQHDTGGGALGTNTRLRWTFHPRGDVFVIYNHNLRQVERRWSRQSSELLVKAAYTLRR